MYGILFLEDIVVFGKIEEMVINRKFVVEEYDRNNY